VPCAAHTRARSPQNVMMIAAKSRLVAPLVAVLDGWDFDNVDGLSFASSERWAKCDNLGFVEVKFLNHHHFTTFHARGSGVTTPAKAWAPPERLRRRNAHTAEVRSLWTTRLPPGCSVPVHPERHRLPPSLQPAEGKGESSSARSRGTARRARTLSARSDRARRCRIPSFLYL
jgi:hypothetical protein